MSTDPAASGVVVDEDHILSADCPCGPEVVDVDSVEDKALRLTAITALASYTKSIAELSRLYGISINVADSTVRVALIDVIDVAEALFGWSEVEVLENLVANDGKLTPPNFDEKAAV